MTATATTVAQRIVDAFNAGDVDAFAACFAPDAVQMHPFFPEPLRGREAIRAAEATLFGAFDDIRLEIGHVLSSGECVAIEFRIRATNSKPLTMPDGSTLPATGRTVELDAAAFLTLDEVGQIVEAHRYEDAMTFMRQLGLS